MRRLAMVLMVALLAGCAPTAGPLDEPPDGLRVTVYQPRPDVAKNRIAIQIHNDGDEPLTVTGASLHSTWWEDAFIWGPDRTATVTPGYAVDLRVDIPATAQCTDDGQEAQVAVSWTVGGRSGASLVDFDDPFDVLALLHDAACLIDEVDAVAGLTAASLTAPESYPAAADLRITVEPTGEPGSVTIDEIHSTTLLMPAGADGSGVSELPIGIELGADGPLEVHVPIVPNRCDAHALAEDKVGTRMPLYVTTSSGSTGRLVLDASDELRAQMYAFYSAYCGL